MALRLLSSDTVDFELVQLIQHSAKGPAPLVVSGDVLTRGHARGGQIAIKGTPLPGMMLANVQWKTADAVLLEDDTPSGNININFQVGGHMYTHFRGLGHDLDMRAGCHNLVYAPEASDSHEIGGNAHLEMLHISIDTDHFKQLIGTENRWCEQVQKDIESGRAFSGMKGTGTITPAMHSILNNLRQPSISGPMHNLRQQALTIELLALQLDQFITASQSHASSGSLSAADADKFHLLKLYIDAHFLEDLSLTQLARIALLNEFKLKKGFKQLFGTTVFGYIKDLRMKYAQRLLRDHSMRVEEVADALGYEHPHHFSAAFRKHFGMRPSDLLIA